MLRREWLVLAVSAAAVGGFMLYNRRDQLAPGAEGGGSARDPAASAAPGGSAGDAARGARKKQPIPRPIGAKSPAPVARAAAPAAEAGAREEDSGALPERGRADPDAAFTPGNIQAAFAEAQPRIQACVDEWIGQARAEGEGGDPVEGRLVLEIVLEPSGVADAVVADAEGLPAPMLSCFGGVVYELDWPLPPERTTVRYPFVVTEE